MSYRSSFLFLLAALLVTGCTVSFNSAQYSFVKGLFDSEPLPPKRWSLVWGETRSSMFAVNHESGIYFVNDTGLLVSFDGWQVVAVRMPENEEHKSTFARKTVSAEGGVSLQFLGHTKQVVGFQECQNWVRLKANVNQNGWEQMCVGPKKNFRNRILLNKSGEIVMLEFYLETKEDVLKLAFNDSSD